MRSVRREDPCVNIKGYFLFRKIEGELTNGGDLSRVVAIEAECGECSLISSHHAGHGLFATDGTGMLSCSNCGNQETISKMRVVEYLTRLAGTSAVSAPHHS